jgi:hypothetical protein
MIKLALILMFMFFTATSAAQPVHGKPAEVASAMRFTQKHYYFSNVELTICKNGVRIEFTGRGRFAVVAKAPSWTVTAFRDDDKSYFEESMEKFVDTSLVSGMVLSYRDMYILPHAKPMPVQVCNFPAVKLRNSGTAFVYFPIDQFAPIAVSNIVHAAYKMPTAGGVPLQFSNRASGKDLVTELDETGHVQILLTTSKITKLSVPLSIFDAPVGYRRTKSVGEVVVSVSKREESTDFQQLFSPAFEGEKHAGH